MENDFRIYSTRNKNHWGPIYWNFLYLTVMGFPVTMNAEQSREFSNLITNFHVFLPCAECRHHYKREVRGMNLRIQDKNTAMKVVLHLHNAVRSRQRKRLFTENDIISYHYNKSKGRMIPIWILLAFGVVALIKIYKIPLTPG